MKRQDAISLLSGSADVIRSLGVDALYLFGSTARDEAREESDVDLFFDYEDGKVFTLVDLITLRDAIANILNRDADVIARNSLHAYLRPKIEAEAVRVL
jgi:predicted nucleotidyltransferase